MEALALVEVLGRNGEVLYRERLFALPALIGRGYDADLIVDDPHVAAHHLRLDADQGSGFALTDLGTLNGFSIPSRGKHCRNAMSHIAPGETVRFGHTQVRVWRPESPVADERANESSSDARAWISFVASLLVMMGVMGLMSWVEATGPGRYGAVIRDVISWTGIVLTWSGLWWIASRSSHHMTSYIAHGYVGASTLLLVLLGLYSLNTVFFAFDLYRSSHGLLSGVVVGVCLAFGVYRHLRLISRTSRKMLALTALAIALALIVPLYYTLKQNDLEKTGLMDIPGQLRPPWMRAVDGISPEAFLN